MLLPIKNFHYYERSWIVEPITNRYPITTFKLCRLKIFYKNVAKLIHINIIEGQAGLLFRGLACLATSIILNMSQPIGDINACRRGSSSDSSQGEGAILLQIVVSGILLVIAMIMTGIFYWPISLFLIVILLLYLIITIFERIVIPTRIDIIM